MKHKRYLIATILLIITLFIVFSGCGDGGWRVENHAETSSRKVFYLYGNDGMSAEYSIRSDATTLIIFWKSNATSIPETRKIEIYTNGEVFKNPMNPSFFDHTYIAEPNSTALVHKFSVMHMAFQYDKVQIKIYAEDDTLLTDKTFPINQMVKKVESYANKKKISLS